MKINELAKQTGLTPATIRFYEQLGLIDDRFVQRKENNYREYREDVVEHLTILKEVQAAGFTLAEFKELDQVCNANDPRINEIAAAVVAKKIEEVSQKITELNRVRTYLTDKLTEIQA